MNEDIQILEIDLFCGAGGVATGSEDAEINGKKVCKNIAAVNHDPLAIASYSENHKGVKCFVEDIRTLDIYKLLEIVKYYKHIYPLAKLLLWASLECTNFSKAKGGLPREADSRTLAEYLYRYIEILCPDIIKIENVEEFMSWGPLDENGKPVSRRQGIDYLRWVNTVKSYGYDFDYRLLVCADYGDYTTRKRYFGQFVKYGLPISWPIPTHSKVAKEDMFGSFKKWNPVKEVLDLRDEGESIFTRKKPPCDKSLDRILAGCEKFAIKGERTFISKYNSNRYNKVSSPVDINKPCPTVTCQNRLAIVNAKFLAKYYSGGGQLQPIDIPVSTLTTKDRVSLVTTQFLDKQYGNGNCQSINTPAGTVTNVPKLNLVSAKWILNPNYNNIGSSINMPAPTIMACRKHFYLLDAQYGNTGKSIENPCPTIIARQDKKPLYLISTHTGHGAMVIHQNDSPTMRKLKAFMNQHGIVDIKMRMLKIKELLLITGFPEEYVLKGSQADQKKFIGNAVPTRIVKAWIEATAYNLKKLNLYKACA